jgi:hypothetical protein
MHNRTAAAAAAGILDYPYASDEFDAGASSPRTPRSKEPPGAITGRLSHESDSYAMPTRYALTVAFLRAISTTAEPRSTKISAPMPYADMDGTGTSSAIP